MIANNIKRFIIYLLFERSSRNRDFFVILILKKDFVCIPNNFFKKLKSDYFRNVVRTNLSEYFSSLLRFSTTHARLIFV